MQMKFEFLYMKGDELTCKLQDLLPCNSNISTLDLTITDRTAVVCTVLYARFVVKFKESSRKVKSRQVVYMCKVNIRDRIYNVEVPASSIICSKNATDKGYLEHFTVNIESWFMYNRNKALRTIKNKGTLEALVDCPKVFIANVTEVRCVAKDGKLACKYFLKYEDEYTSVQFMKVVKDGARVENSNY